MPPSPPTRRHQNPAAAKGNLKSRLASAFSICNNLKLLTQKRHNGPAHLGQLDLLRSASSVWIIVSHSYFFALAWLRFEPATIANIYKSPLEQFLPGATFAVDNFFLLSGLLAQHKQHQLELQQRSSKTSLQQVAASVCGRYLRLAPAMMSLIALSLTLLQSCLCGPLDCDGGWPKASTMFVDWCRPKWALNLVMAHNFVGTERMCMSHAWFVAVEFQLFLALRCSSWLCAGWANDWRKPTLAILVFQALNSLIIYTNDLPAMPLLKSRGSSADEMQAKEGDYYKWLYIKPYHWTASYLVGVLLAGQAHKLHKLAASWPRQRRRLLAALNVLMLAVLVHSNWPFRRWDFPMGRLYAACYAFLVRPLWSLNVASLLILSWRVRFSPGLSRAVASVARLTYSTYLLHPILMATFYGTRNEKFNFSHYLMLHFTLGHLVLAHMFALILFLLIEMPFRQLLRRGDDSETMQPSSPTSSGDLMHDCFELVVERENKQATPSPRRTGESI